MNEFVEKARHSKLGEKCQQQALPIVGGHVCKRALSVDVKYYYGAKAEQWEG